MRSARRPRPCALGLLALVLLVVAERAAGQDVDVLVYSTADSGGELVASYDFGAASAVFQSFCVGGFCLFSSTDPGFRTPATDVPASALFALDAGTAVALELVAVDAGVSVKVGATVLDAPGESAVLGAAPALHIHPEWQVTLPQGTTGDLRVSFVLERSAGGTPYAPSAVYTLVLSNAPAPTPTPSATPPPTPSPTALAALDAYLTYVVQASRRDDLSGGNRFPKGFALTLDDVLLENLPPERYAGDPENHLVAREQGLASPARWNLAPLLAPGRHYLRYVLKAAKEGIGEPTSGKLPRPVAAPKRRWQVDNDLGELLVDTGTAATLWLPAGAAIGGEAVAPGEATHFLCYRASASSVPSEQAPDVSGRGRGRFRSRQTFVADGLDDCRFARDGVTPSFAGTAVEGRCLIDVKAPRQLCSPAAKSAVVPPRSSTATIVGSTPSITDRVLVCYRAKLAGKVTDASAAALAGVAAGTTVKQAGHVKRREKDGSAVATLPGNLFPRPLAVDTQRLDLVCLPSAVLGVEER
jgi:hypothetical protein